MSKDKIIVKGAREHNLKNIDVEIPRNKLVVITGLSGSGKSSLAFDTLYAEGQRRYVESLSAYARQFLELMEKPDVEYIEGLSPAVAIEQRAASKNPRSTVATVTEVYDYMRLLYARIGRPHCPSCGKEISFQTKEQITDAIIELPLEGEVSILAPVVRDRKGEYTKLFADLLKDGFEEAVVDGELRNLDEEFKLDKYKKHSISILLDRIDVSEDERLRLLEAVESSLKLSGGYVEVSTGGEKGMLFSEQLACTTCGINFEQLQPRMFSFNNPHGACPECQGIGTKMEFDHDLIIPDRGKSLGEGALSAWSGTIEGYYMRQLQHVAEEYGFNFQTPIAKLSDDHLNIILYGSGDKTFEFKFVSRERKARFEFEGSFEGVIPNLERRYKETKSEYMRGKLQGFMSHSLCTGCKGDRLKPESLAVTVSGENIADAAKMSVAEAFMFYSKLDLDEKEQVIAKQILREIQARLSFLVAVGLDYLTLDRKAGTLSGGESERIRLATQIGSQLVGVLYILDEPTIGLHQRDNHKLLETLKRLRDLGNTIIVVEHDAETIETSDYVIDLGPGAGVHGGRVVAAGTPKQLMKNKKSLTGQYLSGKKCIPIPEKRRRGNGRFLKIKGVCCHNLKNIDVTIPLGTFSCVTGVSGSGKSSLVNETLAPALERIIHGSRVKPGEYESIEGVSNIDKIVTLDQSPIGRTPRSNPATYTNLFTPIRELYASLPEAKERGYRPGRFSFNVRGGRCEACEGAGVIKIEMHFLPDVYVTCDQCKASRYNDETLEVLYKGKSISDVLDLTVDEASSFFKNIPRISGRLNLLSEVGLGYIKLGQPATTLSGGEAQRIKICLELGKKGTGNTLYVLDEPTTGLHFDDVNKLLSVLGRLVDAGNTVVVIEHNLDVVKTADYLIDLGPDGGDYGGHVVAAGKPEEVSRNPKSYTGQYLKEIL